MAETELAVEILSGLNFIDSSESKTLKTVDSSLLYITIFLSHSTQLVTSTCPSLLCTKVVLLRPQDYLPPTLAMPLYVLMEDRGFVCIALESVLL